MSKAMNECLEEIKYFRRILLTEKINQAKKDNRLQEELKQYIQQKTKIREQKRKKISQFTLSQQKNLKFSSTVQCLQQIEESEYELGSPRNYPGTLSTVNSIPYLAQPYSQDNSGCSFQQQRSNEEIQQERQESSHQQTQNQKYQKIQLKPKVKNQKNSLQEKQKEMKQVLYINIFVLLFAALVFIFKVYLQTQEKQKFLIQI